MTANLFSINSSKTEFIIIGLKQQLSKYTTVLSLNPHRSQPLFIFDENTLPSLNKSVQFLNLATITFVIYLYPPIP